VNESPDDLEHLLSQGGAAFHEGTNLEMTRCRFDRNRACGPGGRGGAIYNGGTGLSIRRSVVTGSLAKSSGAGLELDEGSETVLDHVSVVGNRSRGEDGSGGGIRMRGASSLTMTGGRLVGNRAGSEGGGLWLSATGTATLDGTRISGNRAPSGAQVFDEGEAQASSR